MDTNQTTKKKKGGARPGAGRKKGKAKKTIEREQILEMAKNIVAGRTRTLIDTQTLLAVGTIKVFVIRSHWEGQGKNRRKVKSKPELVSNEEDIIKVIDYEYGEGENPSDDDEYFFVTTKEPDNQAINALLDRTFGKPTENKTLVVEKGMGALLDELEEDD